MTTNEPPLAGVDAFTYSNLSTRPPSIFIRVVSRLLPGVGKVEREVPLYAAQWHERNIEALGSDAPLWIVLGDSISQGIGASSVEQSWVLQAQRALAERGAEYRVVNLSSTGARTTDVIERQVPAMNGLGVAPALVTLLVGSNDMVRREFRTQLPAHYRQLVGMLPSGSLVAVVPRDEGVLAEVGSIVAAAEAQGLLRSVNLGLGMNEKAEDHFHPNDRGHAFIAADFARAILA